MNLVAAAATTLAAGTAAGCDDATVDEPSLDAGGIGPATEIDGGVDEPNADTGDTAPARETNTNDIVTDTETDTGVAISDTGEPPPTRGIQGDIDVDGEF